MPVERLGSGGPWEEIVGYSRVVRAGPFLLVAGTTAMTPDGAVQGGASPYDQARYALEGVAHALSRMGATLNDVVRTLVYVTDAVHWEEVARAHREALGEVRPAATMVEVSRLLDPRLLVEVEAMAYVESGLAS
ncbi:MAG: RidA family protein [Actinomycetota bacterium]|nr:RidA family protein [Actinomycetota bacterium]